MPGKNDTLLPAEPALRKRSESNGPASSHAERLKGIAGLALRHTIHGGYAELESDITAYLKKNYGL